MQFIVDVEEPLFSKGVIGQAIQNALDRGIVDMAYAESVNVRPIP